jgi:putative transposase
MPWKETCRMRERIRFIEAFGKEDEPTLAEVCRRFGVSRKTGYKWLDRYRAFGEVGLQDLAPTAWEQPLRLPLLVEEAVVRLRKEHVRWGPKKLKAVLMRREPDVRWPAPSTIGEVLKRRGLIRPRRRRVSVCRGGAGALECSGPNDLWCTDFKGSFRMGDGSRCHPFTLTDGYSRYLLRCEGLREEKGDAMRQEMVRAFEEFGMPRRLRSDNGPPFGAQAPGGLSRNAIWLIQQQVIPEFITPGQPQENGRHERMHRTLKAETAAPPKGTMAEQQQAFDHFTREYNEERPHEALGQLTPKQVYEPSPRPYTGKLTPPEYVDRYVRYVAKNGNVSFAGKILYVGSMLALQPVGLHQVGEALFDVSYGPVRLGYFLESDRRPHLRPDSPADQAPRSAGPERKEHAPDVSGRGPRPSDLVAEASGA